MRIGQLKKKKKPSKYRHVHKILFSKVTEKYDFISMNKMCIYKCVYVCMSIKHRGLSNPLVSTYTFHQKGPLCPSYLK